MKRKKTREISDEMIGRAEKVCRCSSLVGDIIIARNREKGGKASLRELKESLEKGTGKPRAEK